ncbi:NAD-dependent epimerase/dehydratase family protein [Paenibacillus roseipurpureus]|uniref:NAD-dependent epimerase/dehydratase family protein n=1 Tax=Paenibacillus roseopurpureus TaxID=2918901 RepID=A0AA96LS78_9BACL|nr:NAD-dependent epimerase/dehydratase family protein [Paenibacillus sp. MBLB1832]WNR43765.1 NAD-dependent epimerase/dehydratase family protein [Paenibacillus sp. MBLB1832]
MSIVIITGSAGLIGSEATEFYASLGYKVIGIDNNMRETFFGPEGSTIWNRNRLEGVLGKKYEHHMMDIRQADQLNELFSLYGKEISLIIHTAAQPSHDWAVKDPFTDFGVNANGTLNLLEAMRHHCPEAVFIFTSTNKVYGDRPNTLPLIELETRWEIDPAHAFREGISEEMSVDQSMHSLFGASKLAADILVQEYGRYFNFKTVCFRGGVLSGSKQSGVQLHGFINYLMRCAITGTPYTIFGYEGKQVRDVIHSSDVISAFHAFYLNPRRGGEVYNLGGGRDSNVSMLEAIQLSQEITGREFVYTYSDTARAGDHQWYVSDLAKFKAHYPEWQQAYNHIRLIMEGIYEENKDRWRVAI